MRASKVILSFLVLTLLVSGGIQAQDDPVTTTRDDQGIWYIEGGSLYDVFEAQGYAVATDRLFQMDLFRRRARGTISELFGAEFLGGDYLSTDISTRNIMYSDDEYTEMFNGLSEEAQTVVQAYINGVNRRIFDIYNNFYLMPYEYWIGSFYSIFVENLSYNMLPRPFEVNDVLAWAATMLRNFDAEGSGGTAQLDNLALLQTWAAVFPEDYLYMFGDMRWVNDPSAQTMIPHDGGAKAKQLRELPNITADSYPDISQAAEEIRSLFEQREKTFEAIGAAVTFGSYAWAVSGDRTASGNPMIYSGPQMRFWTPVICVEGSIRGGGYEVSGMTFPLFPGILIGRTPHHAWSMQVGHAHTLDWFLDAPQSVFLHHEATIHPAGGDPVTIPIYRSHHGPIVNPFPYDPENPPTAAVSYGYAHWGREAKSIDGFLQLAKATSIEEFDQGHELLAVSQHSTYADRDGNIAYWMSGWDPIRQPHSNPLIPRMGNGTEEWTGERRERAHDSNPAQGYYGGWNNKASMDYDNATNNHGYYLGTAHRAHVVDEYLATHDDLTFEEVRDLALNIATTSSWGGGGNTWSFVADAFSAAVAANSSPDRDAAIAMLDAWDGHFVAGGSAEWRMGTERADAWVLQDEWIREVLRLVFEDEFMMVAGMEYDAQPMTINFNVLLRALAGHTFNDWFLDRSGSGKPETAEELIILALDNVIADIGLGPYHAERGTIDFTHDLLSELDPAFEGFYSLPFSERSTYAHVVEYGEEGPVRIESMFPLGQSGQLWFNGFITPVFDANYFTMAPAFDPFMPRTFPLFD